MKPLKTKDQEIVEANEHIARWVARRDQLLNTGDLSNDMALERNVDLIPKLYREKNFRELANVGAMVSNLCKVVSKPQMTYEQALKEHAKMPPGVPFPAHWNAIDGQCFRFGVPTFVQAGSGVGKSTFLRNIAVNNLLLKIPTLYFTNEDSMSEAVIGMFTIFSRWQGGRQFSFQEVEKWLHDAHNGDKEAQSKARVVVEFGKKLSEWVRIVEAEYWSMSSIILETERTENYFGEMVKCAMLDYIQLVEPEHGSRAQDVRLQNIEKSKLWKLYFKGKFIAPIVASQGNKDGGTAESSQFEKDAGTRIIIEREQIKDTDELSNEVKIRIVKGRRTGTGRLMCYFDGPSGAFIRSQDWSPMKKNLYAND